MPTVKFYKPDASLQWIVKQFETIRQNNSLQMFTDKFIPRPDAALVFHFKNIPKVITPVNMLLQPYFIAPVVSIPNQLQIQGELDGFIVVCKASVLSRIFKLDMVKKSNMMVELPAKIFAPLWERLNKTTSDMERMIYFSEFIHNYSLQAYKPDPVDIIYDDIVDNILKFSMQNISANSFHSLSSLQRNFNKRVGVSMKRLMRISRIYYIFKNMLNDQSFKSQKLMFEGNYYDQSHFINDFKEITGEPPKQFFQHNTELCRILSGMFKGDISIS
ncbi:MAG: AraC family transcriptional regulator [Bacteroidales bacterium]|nr:AraC family transcriptional regulator [Bacteroidales bacterium]MBN2818473.1 AraC family transcriptional regulator [Bacteroidales bacterium]